MSHTGTAAFDILIRGCIALTSDPAQPVIDDAVIGIRGDRWRWSQNERRGVCRPSA
jgi:hypothetical protein